MKRRKIKAKDRAQFERGRSGNVAAEKGPAMTPEQHATVNAALARYGARLTDESRIAKGEKVTGIRAEVRKGRLRMVSADSGNLHASFPASKLEAGVSNFVERFWYWQPVAAGPSEARERAAVLHEPTTAPVLHEPPAQVPTCLPWVKVTRDVEKYEACLAQAKKLGPINNARKVYDLLHKTLDERDEECFLVVLLDVRKQLRGVAEIARGQRSKVTVAIADIMRSVITGGAELFVIAHAHPSGNCEPSDEDRRLTDDVDEACIPYAQEFTFADHVVLGMREFYSIREGKKYTVS